MRITRKYEAGTPPLVEAHGLGIAIDYMNKIGLDNIIEHENEITKYAFNKLNEIDFVEIHGGDNKKILSYPLILKMFIPTKILVFRC